jgi:hypothetical protein
MPTLPSRFAVISIIWAAAMFLGLQVFAIYATVWRVGAPEPEQALLIDGWHVVNPIVGPDDTVVFSMRARRQYACISLIAAFWIAEDGRAVVRFPPLTGGYTPVNMDGYEVPVEVPAPAINSLTGQPLEPGIYIYRSMNVPLCPDLLPTESPEARVCLVVPGKPEPPCVRKME